MNYPQSYLSFLSLILFFLIGNNSTIAQNFAWVEQLNVTPQIITTDNSGAIFSSGYFFNTVDLDNGPSTANHTSIGSSSDVYLLKLTSFGTYLWSHQIGGSIHQNLHCLLTDSLGNSYLAGVFEGTSDFDVPNNINSSSNGNKDIFLQKISPTGNVLWTKTYGGTGEDVIHSIALDKDENLYLMGRFNGTVDFDPGTGVFPLVAAGNNDYFIQKLDPNGNFVFAKQIAGNPSSIAVDKNYNIYAIGNFSGTTDFDRGPGVMNLTATGAAFGTPYDMFFQKLDANADFLWVKHFEESSSGNFIDHDEFLHIVIDDSLENIFLAGHFDGIVDFDPNSGTTNLTAGSAIIQPVLAKFDFNGNLDWAILPLVANGVAALAHLDIDKQNNIYMRGATDATDMDPGLGVINFSGGKYIQKLDSNSNFVWFTGLDSPGSTGLGGLALDKNGNIYGAGYFDLTVDFDPSSDTFNLTADTINGAGYIFKLGQDSCSNLLLLIDSVADVNCTNAIGWASGHILNGISPYSYLWSNGATDSFTTITMGNIYSLTATDVVGCSRTSSVLINSPNHVTDFDLNPNLVMTSFRAGLPSILYPNLMNDGCILTSGQLILVLDSLLTYDSASISPITINGDSLFWNFTNLAYDSSFIVPMVYVTVDSTALFGTAVCLELIARPISGDIDSLNNIKNYCRTIINSYDPNDKRVYPQGTCQANYVHKDEVLTYSIRFQNTGNADAINIYLLDSLDANLDLSTLRIIDKSHPKLITEILPGNVLKFRFDNIYLPDSFSNEAASHGYVIYEILPLTSANNGMIVNNQAGIFFDFNPPVWTNTLSNTLIDSVISVNHTTTLSGNTLTATQSNSTYQWLDCDNGFQPIAGATNQSFTPSFNGNFAVLITNGNCVEQSACQSVVINNLNSFQNLDYFKLYPNPSNGHFYVELDHVYTDIKLMLVDLTGKVIHKQQALNTQQIELNLNPPKGIYFIQVQLDNQKVMSSKILIH